MSDKSKLGFNINPKNYDELNSADNLITSGSDSGWLGKKLQGDDSNDLDLSKINPLFDKELYEKYRPGVNTNDGSVNQDIWGYKCFNSPVSFRNGIYGDTYSIKSIEGIEDSVIHKSTYNGVSTAVNDKSNADDKYARDNVRYSYNLTNELLTAQEKSYIASTYTGKLRRALNSAVRPTYDLFKKDPRVYGSSIENETSASGDIRTDCFWLYTYCNPDKTKLNIYNGINAYSSNAPTQYINERNEINIASTIFNDDNTGTTQDTEHTYSESRVTVGTNCKEDIVIKDYTSAAGNCIRMYSTNGRYRNAEYINDNISSIIITPEIINTSVDNKIITIDYHTDKLTGDDYNYSKPVIDIAFDYTKATDDPANLIFFQIASLLNIQDATVSDAEDTVPSINVHGIFKNGNDDIIKYRGTRITPTSIAVNAIQFNRFIMGDTFISNIHNKLVPVEYIFKQNDTDETGTNTYGLKLLSCDGKLKTSFICDYLVVNESIKYKSTVSYTDRLVYIDPETNNTTNVLTVQSNNLILPSGNNTIQLGRADNRFGTIYGDLNGTAVIAEHAGTAEQATKDQDGNIIKSSYLNILDFGRNDIESYNAIIGNEKEKLLFLKEKYFSTSADIPPKNKSYASIKCSFTDTHTSYKTIISWSNEAEDKPITKLCHVDYNLAYNYTTKKHSFYIIPNGVASDDPKYVESMNIGAPDAHWDSIYCDKFPTIHKTIGGYLVGSIRLLCIKTPATSIVGREAQIYPGDTFGTSIEVLSSNTGTGTLTCTVSHAVFKVTGESAMHLEPTTTPMLEGTWQALCGVHIVIGKSITYIPVLAIRVK